MRIAELYTTGKPIFSLEFFTPKDSEGKASLLRAMQRLQVTRPSYVSITCGAAGTTRERTADLSIEFQRQFQVTTMAHLVCTGTTVAELGETLRYMTSNSIENILALRGDPPRGDDAWRPIPGGLRHASELAAFIKNNFNVCIGAACYPEKHHEAQSMDEDIANLKRKVDAGAEFLITQVFFDNNAYWSFVERARNADIKVPIVPGIMPLHGLTNLKRIAALSPGTSIPSTLCDQFEKTSDPAQVLQIAADYAANQCRDLIERGAPGIHFYTLNRSGPTVETVQRLEKI